MTQDITWCLGRGFDQLFPLDRRGGNVHSALIAMGSGRTCVWLLSELSTCKMKEDSMAGHGSPVSPRTTVGAKETGLGLGLRLGLAEGS